MRATALFFCYMLACLLLAGGLAGPLAQTGWFDLEPHRLVARLAQILMLLGIWPLLRALHLDRREALGYGMRRGPLLRGLGLGWLAGVAILSLVFALLLAFGTRVWIVWSPDYAGLLIERLLRALVAGLLIAAIEETFFRGALFSAIRRHGSLAAAALWSAGLYAAVHFMKPPPLPPGQTLDAAASLALAAGTLTGIAQWQHLDSLVALFLAGLLLALVRERTGHIGWCIGLHAGWVFAIQSGRRLSHRPPESDWALLAGQYDGVIGWLAAACIGLLTLVYWILTRPRASQPNSTEAC